MGFVGFYACGLPQRHFRQDEQDLLLVAPLSGRKSRHPIRLPCSVGALFRAPPRHPRRFCVACKELVASFSVFDRSYAGEILQAGGGLLIPSNDFVFYVR
jgi:hypothetical protein